MGVLYKKSVEGQSQTVTLAGNGSWGANYF